MFRVCNIATKVFLKVNSEDTRSDQFFPFLNLTDIGRSKDTSSERLPSRHLLVKVKNANTRTMYEICSKFTLKTPEGRH